MLSHVIFLAFFGACLASFANVLIYRLPLGISVVSRHASFCPRCEANIAWFDKMPIVSYLILRGRCRNCGQAISKRYLALEASGLILGIIAAVRFGPTPEAVVMVMILVNLMTIAVMDFKYQQIHDLLIIYGGALGVIWVIVGQRSYDTTVIAVAIVVAALMLLSYVFKLFKDEEVLGTGDVLLMGVIATYTGTDLIGPYYPKLMAILFLGCVIGIVYAIYDRKVRGEFGRVPFGTFLTLATGIVLMF